MSLLARLACVLVTSFLVGPGTAWAASAPVKSFLRPALAKAGAASDVGLLSPAMPVAFNSKEMMRMAPGEIAEFELPNGALNSLVLEKVIAHGGGDATWIGHVAERGKFSRVIITAGKTGTYASIESTSGVFRVVPGNGTHDWLVNEKEEMARHPQMRAVNDGIVVDTTDMPKPDLRNAAMSVPSPTDAKATPVPQATVDIMFVVTQGLATALGSNLSTRLNFLIQRANDSYAASEIAITARFVGSMTVNYPDDTNDGLALDSITPGRAQFNAAVFGNVETTRTTLGADIVGFLRNGSQFGGSGVAWVPKTPTSNLMYNTVQGCVAACESVWIHEAGHNMGLMHDRATVAWQAGGVAEPLGSSQQGSYPYSFGYAFCKGGQGNLTCSPGVPGSCTSQPECNPDDPNNFSDIMAYFHATTDRLYKFSNPSINCIATTNNDGIQRPCGVPSANSITAAHLANPTDGAQSLNNNRALLSAIKATTIGSSIQFTASSFSATEGGTITFTVSRTGGSSGAASVNYAVTSGTATSGVDFPVTSGTLNWADGDATNKTFTVSTTADATAEGVESFTATLSGPAGTPAAVLGSPSVASGVISEAWPPGGTFPAGFTNPSGPAWAIAADFSSDGDNVSLKSGALVFGGGVAPAASVLQWAGTLNAGTISFSYQVNSYPGFGFFEFLVDGAVAMTDSGVPGAKSFSLPVAAGAHTLQWRYRTTLTFPCSNALPAPPQGNTCADRAWIDSVSLPLPALPATTTVLTSSANPSGTGQAVTFTATMTGSNGGTVVFRDGNTVITGCDARPVTAGTATCTTSALTVGSHSITAGYSGTTAVGASLSNTVTQVVNASVTVTVTKAGAGSGTVTSNVGGINCGATCSGSVNNGASVTLTATPLAGSVFTGWTGACSGTGTCSLTPTANVSVTATFSLALGSPSLVVNNVAALAFGGQSVKTTSPAVVVDLVNAGTGTLTITSVVAAGANATEFTVSHTCTTLTLGQSCPVSVTFTPQAAGARTGALNIANSIGPASFGMTGTGEQSLVTHYYRSILRRAPDGPGKAFWDGEATRMQTSGVNINETWYSMAQAFYSSPEYVAFGRDNNGFVTDLYNTFFNRGPDGPGLAFWTGQIGSGMPREVVLASFMFSTEFVTFTQGIFGNTAVRKEIDTVTDFYRGLLGRLPDGGGLTFWIGQFRAAQCAGAGATAAVNGQAESISSSFAIGGEYAARARSNSQYVGDLYNAFLRRGGDLAGVQFWVNALNAVSLTREQVRQQFVASAEFQGRVAAIIAQGCLP